MAEQVAPGRAALLAVLGLPPDAVEPQITRSYRRLARQTHPDVLDPAREPAEAAGRFAEVNDAYHRLLARPAAPTAAPATSTEVRVSTARPRWPRQRPQIAAGPVVVTPPPGSRRRGSHGR